MRHAGERGQEAPARGLGREVRIGWFMALFLAVQTVLEYLLAQVIDANLPIMVAINISEAAAIMVYFMHLPRLWRGREEE